MISDNIKRIIRQKMNMIKPRSIEVLSEECIIKNIVLDKPLIFYIGKKYNYGDPSRGLGYEYYNLYNSLLRLGYSLIYFDYDDVARRFGAKKMSLMLRELTYQYQPEFLFYVHSRDIIDHSIWQEISNDLPTKTIIYLADDFWRREQTKSVWTLFNVIVTLDKHAYNARLKEGFLNVFLSQWAANPFIYKNLSLDRKYDVSFVGQAYGNRPHIINTLREAGIKVDVFGRGWPKQKRILQSDFIRIYNQSKIVFNISETSYGNLAVNARDFEAPACGSLLFTRETPDIHEYFIPGKEVVTYQNLDDAIKKIKHYLEHENERKTIAEAGYKRIISDHTYGERFNEIFAFTDKIKK